MSLDKYVDLMQDLEDEKIDRNNFDISKIPIEITGWSDTPIIVNQYKQNMEKIKKEEANKKFYKTSFVFSDMYPKAIPDLHIYFLNKILFDTIHLLGKHHIPYFADGSTLLGAIRHQGHIPWSDSNNIGLMKKDFKRLKKIVNEIQEYHDEYKVEHFTDHHIKIFICDHWVEHENGMIVATPTLDIWEYTQIGETVLLRCKDSREIYPNSKYNRSDLFPVKEYLFDKNTVYGANNPHPYLDAMYPAWKTTFLSDKRDAKNPLLKL